jgi:hypothetical protein
MRRPVYFALFSLLCLRAEAVTVQVDLDRTASNNDRVIQLSQRRAATGSSTKTSNLYLLAKNGVTTLGSFEVYSSVKPQSGTEFLLTANTDGGGVALTKPSDPTIGPRANMDTCDFYGSPPTAGTVSNLNEESCSVGGEPCHWNYVIDQPSSATDPVNWSNEQTYSDFVAWSYWEASNGQWTPAEGDRFTVRLVTNHGEQETTDGNFASCYCAYDAGVDDVVCTQGTVD